MDISEILSQLTSFFTSGTESSSSEEKRNYVQPSSSQAYTDINKNINVSGLNSDVARKARALVLEAAKQGISLIISNTLRSTQEQSRLYEQGRTTEGPIVTNAKPGTSKHEFGHAFDVAVADKNGTPTWPEDNDLWNKIGTIGESLGLKWGGRFKTPDRPHFESKYTLEQIKSNKTKGTYERLTSVDDKRLNEISQYFLGILKDKPYGSYKLFSYKGSVYKAVIEEHVGGRVSGPHPGISLFKKANNYNLIYKLSNEYYELIKK